MNLDPSTLPLFIDTDNALGSPFGDVDDAFAVAALLKSNVSVLGLSSVFGNTFEPWAHQNNDTLAGVCGFKGKIYRGASQSWSKESEISTQLAAQETPVRVLAIGPLTNISIALKQSPKQLPLIKELVIVGTNLSRRLPAFRFFDFNQSKDPKATRLIFDSTLPLTCVPCDVARHLRASAEDVARLKGSIGCYLAKGTRRWFLRARLLKRMETVPVWDLAAAIYLIAPDLYKVEHTFARIGRWGEAHFGPNEKRPVQVVRDFDSEKVWQRFVQLIEATV